MNIKQAKEEIINTVRAYTKKDASGEYEIPVERQRPILLIGPPGIGKTAIMEQVAQECGINLVSYTITHHTRQSAIGLPFIESREYGGKPYKVTEYTMSEIIASVYDQIEKSGVKEGILFLDEINCVSETLAPTMLQFLQYKTFGTHRVPDGFIIVTAGNPPQYNKSVRDFDIATLDRVKKINVEENFDVWKEYAYKMGIHGSIMAYLEIRKENFYSIRTEVEDRYFVTARGWEDLSRIISVYEELHIPVTADLAVQYIQDPKIAEDFATYYELYNKYKNIYRIPDVLQGVMPADQTKIKNSPFDEKLSLISLLIDSLNGEFRGYAQEKAVQENLFHALQQFRSDLKSGRGRGAQLLSDGISAREESLKKKVDARMISRADAQTERLAIAALKDLQREMTLSQGSDAKADFLTAKNWFAGREEKRQKAIQTAGSHLTNAFSFMANVFGEGQEMVIFLSALTAGYYSLQFVSECGNDAYYHYNKLLLLKDRREALRQEVLDLGDLN